MFLFSQLVSSTWFSPSHRLTFVLATSGLLLVSLLLFFGGLGCFDSSESSSSSSTSTTFLLFTTGTQTGVLRIAGPQVLFFGESPWTGLPSFRFFETGLGAVDVVGLGAASGGVAILAGVPVGGDQIRGDNLVGDPSCGVLVAAGGVPATGGDGGGGVVVGGVGCNQACGDGGGIGAGNHVGPNSDSAIGGGESRRRGSLGGDCGIGGGIALAKSISTAVRPSSRSGSAGGSPPVDPFVSFSLGSGEDVLMSWSTSSSSSSSTSVDA